MQDEEKKEGVVPVPEIVENDGAEDSATSEEATAKEVGANPASQSKDNVESSHDRRDALRGYSRNEDFMINEEKYENQTLELTDASSWAIPWSDLMMTMFILFAVLLVYTLSERDIKDAMAKETGSKGKTAPMEKSVLPPFSPEQLLEASRQSVKEANLDDVEVTLGADRSVKVSVRGPMLFDLGSAELRDATKEFLRKMAAVLKKTPNEVHVIGHTDNFTIHSELYPTNWELSAVRAAKVARYLIEQGSLEPERFVILGSAMYRPAVPNTSPENKQKNRRVEIIITRDVYKGATGG